MKRKTKKIYFEAASLLLLTIILIGTGLQSSTAIELFTGENEQEINDQIIQPNLPIKNIVIGKGTICYLKPVNLDNFEGDIWVDDSGLSYIEGARGWIKNTDIDVGKYWPNDPLKGGYLIMIFPQFLKTIYPSYQIKNFSGWIYYEYESVPHGGCYTDFTIMGTSDNILPG
jgi:hypothetical protein